MKAVGYLRVSKPPSHKLGRANIAEGVGLQVQRAKIEAWCALSDMPLAAVFEESPMTGTSLKHRPECERALAALGRGDVLVVYSLSRLARSTRDTLALYERLEAAGAELASVTEKIDTSTAAGKLMFRLMAIVNEFERDVISERTSAALQLKRSQGAKYGPVPLGYQSVDGLLVPDPVEAALVREIIEQAGRNVPLSAIAEGFNARGITGKQGGRWRPGTIADVLARYGLREPRRRRGSAPAEPLPIPEAA